MCVQHVWHSTGLCALVLVLVLVLYTDNFRHTFTSVSQLTPAGDEGPTHSYAHDVKNDAAAAALNWTFPGVQQCFGESDVSLCSWCNWTFTKQYPFVLEQFSRAYIPGARMPPGLLHKLQTGRPVSISIVGGSVTAGRDCRDGSRSQKGCAWPSRLQDRLLQLYPGANLTVVNLAMPAHHYFAWLTRGELSEAVQADVMLVDLQVNSVVSWWG